MKENKDSKNTWNPSKTNYHLCIENKEKINLKPNEKAALYQPGVLNGESSMKWNIDSLSYLQQNGLCKQFQMYG